MYTTPWIRLVIWFAPIALIMASTGVHGGRKFYRSSISVFDWFIFICRIVWCWVQYTFCRLIIKRVFNIEKNNKRYMGMGNRFANTRWQVIKNSSVWFVESKYLDCSTMHVQHWKSSPAHYSHSLNGLKHSGNLENYIRVSDPAEI